MYVFHHHDMHTCSNSYIVLMIHIIATLYVRTSSNFFPSGLLEVPWNFLCNLNLTMSCMDNKYYSIMDMQGRIATIRTVQFIKCSCTLLCYSHHYTAGRSAQPASLGRPSQHAWSVLLWLHDYKTSTKGVELRWPQWELIQFLVFLPLITPTLHIHVVA